MDASQYKDYVLTMLFVKYISDKYKDDPFGAITVPDGATFDDMVALIGNPEIGDKINKQILNPIKEANKLTDFPDFNDENKLGKGKDLVDTVSNLVRIFNDPSLDLSVLLQELIEKRKQDMISYQEYLKEMAELVRQVNQGKKDDLPDSLNTKGKVALYHTLEDENLALACEEAIQYAKQEGFRENLAKQNLVKKAIYDVVKDKDKVNEIYKIIDAHKDEY